MADNSANNVDQIRELIFGSQIKEFETRFGQLEEKISETKETLLAAFRESHTALQKETDRSLEVLEKKIDHLGSASQKERANLKELIHTTEQTIQKQLGHQKEEYETKLTMLKEATADENKRLQENMAQMKSTIESMLKENLDTLSSEKLSRDAMAEMLLDVAMKLQGTDINTLLSTEDASKK